MRGRGLEALDPVIITPMHVSEVNVLFLYRSTGESAVVNSKKDHIQNIHDRAMLTHLLSPTITSALKTSIPTSSVRVIATMAAPNSNNSSQTLWSSTAKDKTYSGGSRTFATDQQQQQQASNSTPQASNNNNNPKQQPQKRTTSPSHRPKTSHASNQKEPVYILTLQTDPAHHARMTALRNKYFPPHLNKLEAHLTFFHALPESKLASAVLPALERVAASTTPFDIEATQPFRMKKGFGISVPEGKGGARARQVRGELLGMWQGEDDGGWLSEQDSGMGYRTHYTVMNKVEDEGVVRRAFGEVEREFGVGEGDRGRAVGLGLWRYERGWWKWVQGFEFGGGEGRSG